MVDISVERRDVHRYQIGIWRQGRIQEFFMGGAFEAEAGTAELRAPERTASGRAGDGCGRGSPPSAAGVRGYNPRKIFEIT